MTDESRQCKIISINRKNPLMKIDAVDYPLVRIMYLSKTVDLATDYLQALPIKSSLSLCFQELDFDDAPSLAREHGIINQKGINKIRLIRSFEKVSQLLGF